MLPRGSFGETDGDRITDLEMHDASQRQRRVSGVATHTTKCAQEPGTTVHGHDMASD